MGQQENSLGEQINLEYRLYCEMDGCEIDRLSQLLMQYLTGIIRMNLRMANVYAAEEDVEDVLQTTMADIWEKGLKNYSENKGQFATYCGRIATNKSLDYRRRMVKRFASEISEENYENIASDTADASYFSSNPETLVLQQEYYRQCEKWAERFLKTFVGLDVKPYKLVGSGYSIILSKKYPTKDNKNDLTSAKWALEQLENASVQDGADGFIEEVNSWIKYIQIRWPQNFNHAMQLEEFGQKIGQLIFGAHFGKKSIENWDSSIRKRIKREMAQSYYKMS